MATRGDGLALVRAGLCERVDGLARSLPARPGPALFEQIAALGATAAEYGFQPLAELAGALTAALGSGARAPTVRLYLEAMRDAAGCERADPAAGEALMASVGLRLAG